MSAPPHSHYCRFCGGFPATQATVRAHRGMIIVMTFRRLTGPFCRTCGLATVRSMSGQTLVEGWWGLFSAVITPITLLANLVTYRRIRALPERVPGQPGPGMDPGKPLLRRPQAAGFAVPFVAVGLLATLAFVSPGTFRQPDDVPVGQCAFNAGSADTPNLVSAPCGPGTLQVVSKLTDTQSGSDCPMEATQYYVHEETSDLGSFVLCLMKYPG